MDIELTGQIERITYTDTESGFTIARVKVEGESHLVTVVGTLMAATPGEVLTMKGQWAQHPKFGRQFKMTHYRTVIPQTVAGIEKYLGSGLIKGVGPVMAERIVKRFGTDTLTVLEKDIDQLSQVEGIGQKRIEQIKQAWKDQKDIRDLVILLQTHHIGSGYASKIYKRYGKQAVEMVTRNPYQLAIDIVGIGFRTADQMAEKLNIRKDSPLRVTAGLLHQLQQLSDEGHVYFPYDRLIRDTQQLLDVDRDVILDGVATLSQENRIVIEDVNEDIESFKANHKAVYLAALHTCETGVAKRLKGLLKAPKQIQVPDIDRAVNWVQDRLAIVLADQQVRALRLAFEYKVLVITGGPGTGKTTIINAVLKVFSHLTRKILLAAPTGRAAKRMTEATGFSARTIHRMLEYNATRHRFQRDAKRPLECDLLVIDEASMVDTVLMHHLLKAIPTRGTFLLVGDINQLPSVGPGNVLGDIIQSGQVPVVVLDQIFRQAKQSQIVVNAHRINQGRFPRLDPTPVDAATDRDFYFIEQDEPDKVLALILTLVKDRIPHRFGLDAHTDIQVLSPMHRGLVGTANLNTHLQERLNPGRKDLLRGDQSLRIHDKVMQIRNNYDKSVFNGDIGTIADINHRTRTLQIVFDQKTVEYEFSELDEIVLAYAISVHKAQGSEYPAIVFPVLTQHYMLLQRNLIYTAVTRGKRLVVMVGTRKALTIGIRNDKTQRRYTYLKQRLI
jgi:exodeoxyribonuclease V alpha subunit